MTADIIKRLPTTYTQVPLSVSIDSVNLGALVTVRIGRESRDLTPGEVIELRDALASAVNALVVDGLHAKLAEADCIAHGDSPEVCPGNGGHPITDCTTGHYASGQPHTLDCTPRGNA